MTFDASSKTTVNKKEYLPGHMAIGFAPELINFIYANKKVTTYRLGRKYDHFKIGDIVTFDNSSTGQAAGRIRITGKRMVKFADLPPDTATHEVYRDKEHQRRVLSGYYAFLGREIYDNDEFLVFDFELVPGTTSP